MKAALKRYKREAFHRLDEFFYTNEKNIIISIFGTNTGVVVEDKVGRRYSVKYTPSKTDFRGGFISLTLTK